jgi:hypothetical protein
MAIEIFWSPKGVQMCAIILEKQPSLSLLGNRKNLVANQWWGHVGWQRKKIQSPFA